VVIADTGVVARRSRPQDGQNFDFSVTSLPQREQNMGSKLPTAPRYIKANGGLGIAHADRGVDWHTIC
jgi:hypothetical protein